MHTLDITAPIEFIDGTKYTLVERDSAFVRLRNIATGSPRDMHMSELARHVVGLQPSLARSPQEMEHLTERNKEKVNELADHIRELLTGEPLPGRQRRPEYDPEVHTQNARVAAKVEELQRMGKPGSRATLMRKISAFRDSGRGALIDGRARRTINPLEQLHPLIKDELIAVIASQKFKSTGPARRIIYQTKVNLLKNYGPDAPAMPSDRSMYRYISMLSIGKHTTGSAKTRQSVANRPQGVNAQRHESLPGAEVQVDSTKMDILVRKSDGTAVRPTLTVMVDRNTRSILAHTVLFTAAKSEDHVGLLLRALTPSQNRPDNSEWRNDLQRANPQVTLLPPEERALLELQRPFIYPRRIMMDNGKDFIGGSFQAALEKFRIEATLSAPHTPTNKPHVERLIGTINRGFCAYLPGYTGGSVENRGHKVEEEELIDIFALHQLLDDWIIGVYHATPHGGLTHPIYPDQKLTPNQMVHEAAKLTSTIHIPLTRADYIDAQKSYFVRISQTGVQVKNRQYDSPELIPYRDQLSNRVGNKARKWEVKVDTHNPHEAWVRSPDNTWIHCELRNKAAGMHPHLEDTRIKPIDADRSAVATITARVDGVPMHHPAPDPIEAFRTDMTVEDYDLDIAPFDPEED
jgi:transposase InsO family protein